jgi:hypothetical protein
MLRKKRESRSWILFAVVMIILLVVLTWGNYSYAVHNPGGNDFLVHWMGLRLLFQKGISPYSDEAAAQIQTYAYGHPAEEGQHELRVAYPLYSVILFGPFTAISNYNLARAIWMTFSEASLLLLAYLSARLVDWKPKLWLMAIFLLFSVLFYHDLRPLINGNAVIFIALGIVTVLLALKAGLDELAGSLLALCTIKPQVVAVFIAFIFFWAIFQKRKKVILWFFIILALLCGAAALLLPDWILQNLREIVRFPSYNPPGNPSAALAYFWGSTGTRLGTALTILTIAALAIEWWLARKADFQVFLWTASLTLIASFWVGIQADPGNFIVAFPGLVLVFSIWQKRWKKTGIGLIVGAMIILLISIWAIFLRTIEYSYEPIQSPVMLFPYPIILIAFLYWVRWWAVHPPSVWYDELLAKIKTK